MEAGGLAVIAIKVKDKDGVSNRWTAWLAVDMRTAVEYLKREEILAVEVSTIQEIPLDKAKEMERYPEGVKAITNGISPAILGIIER